MSDGKIPADIDQIATRIASRFLGENVSCEAIYRDVSEAILAERSAQEAALREASREAVLNFKSKLRIAFRRALSDLPEIAPAAIQSVWLAFTCMTRSFRKVSGFKWSME